MLAVNLHCTRIRHTRDTRIVTVPLPITEAPEYRFMALPVRYN
jgi:hypothetical protein